MQRRILAHQGRRPAAWQTRELPFDVGRQLMAAPLEADVVLLDCVTVLVSNVLLRAAPDVDRPDARLAQDFVASEVEALIGTMRSIEAHWLVISNEVGQGLVPPYPSG